MTDRIEAIRDRYSNAASEVVREDVAWLLAEVTEARDDAAHWEAEYDIAVGGVEGLKMIIARVEALAATDGVWKGEKHVRLTRRDPRLGCEITESYVRVDDLNAALTGPEPEESP